MKSANKQRSCGIFSSPLDFAANAALFQGESCYYKDLAANAARTGGSSPINTSTHQQNII